MLDWINAWMLKQKATACLGLSKPIENSGGAVSTSHLESAVMFSFFLHLDLTGKVHPGCSRKIALVLYCSIFFGTCLKLLLTLLCDSWITKLFWFWNLVPQKTIIVHYCWKRNTILLISTVPDNGDKDIFSLISRIYSCNCEIVAFALTLATDCNKSSVMTAVSADTPSVFIKFLFLIRQSWYCP